jgi:hypothetical protein
VKKQLRFSLVALACVLAVGAPAIAAEEAVIEEVLAILKERGIVDEARHAELVAKNQAYEARRVSLLSKIIWTGDFRARLEDFWFQEDDLGGQPDDRHRGRYRLRIGAVVPINDWVTAGFRLASGETENRSTNRSLGQGVDFDRDTIAIDEAYLQIKLPIDVGSTSFVFGKQSNPFLWKNGKDYMTWDPDYSPEGVSLRFTMQPSDSVSVFANAGYFLIDEQKGAKDPHYFALQGGGQLQAAEKLAFGGRATWYSYASLNSSFFTRHGLFGNEDLSDRADGSIDQLELSAYGRASYRERWPVLVHAHFTKNFDAASLPGEGKQDTGWGIAVEAGDAKQFAMLGVGYYNLEADFAPALYIDSDLTDGVTNRKGWAFYGTRQIFPNTELTLELFMSDVVDSSPIFAGDGTSLDPGSVAGSERLRLRTDVVVKF